MNNIYCTTNEQERKRGQHLKAEERGELIPKVSSTVEFTSEVSVGRKMW